MQRQKTHKHIGRTEKPYVWRGLSALVEDFLNEVEALR